jgi:hypothetical protein
MGADGRDEPGAEVAPVAQGCRERGTDLTCPQLEQPVTRTATERGFKPVHQRDRERKRVVCLNREQQVAPGGQRE